jgi:hypothetical protein
MTETHGLIIGYSVIDYYLVIGAWLLVISCMRASPAPLF